MTITERFVRLVIDEDSGSVKPVFCEDGVSFVWIRYSNLYLLAVSQRNANALMLLAYLYRLAEVLKDYFQVLEEESIRDNFVLHLNEIFWTK